MRLDDFTNAMLKPYVNEPIAINNLNEELATPVDDGWEVSYELEDILSDIESLAYELRNCRRGSYTGCDTEAELASYVLRLADSLKSAADDVAGIDESLNEDVNGKHVSQVSFDVLWDADENPLAVDDFIEFVTGRDFTDGGLEILGCDSVGMDDQYKQDGIFDESLNEEAGSVNYWVGDQWAGDYYDNADQANKAFKNLVDQFASHPDCDTVSIQVTPLGEDGNLLEESLLDEGKKELAIAKILNDEGIMDIMQKDPAGAIKRAKEAVNASDEVSAQDKNLFNKATSGSLSHAASSIASFAWRSKGLEKVIR